MLLGSLSEDLTGSMEPSQLRRVLSSALDWVRPYHLAIGFRVRKLSRSQVEAVIPNRLHNQNSQGEIEEGVVVSVALQMAKLLIARWEVPLDYELDHIHLDRLQPMKGELTARLEWEDLTREALRAELVKNSVAVNELFIHLIDSQEKRVADIAITLKVRMPQSLSQSPRRGKGSHGDRTKRN